MSSRAARRKRVVPVDSEGPTSVSGLSLPAKSALRAGGPTLASLSHEQSALSYPSPPLSTSNLPPPHSASLRSSDPSHPTRPSAQRYSHDPTPHNNGLETRFKPSKKSLSASSSAPQQLLQTMAPQLSPTSPVRGRFTNDTRPSVPIQASDSLVHYPLQNSQSREYPRHVSSRPLPAYPSALPAPNGLSDAYATAVPPSYTSHVEDLRMLPSPAASNVTLNCTATLPPGSLLFQPPQPRELANDLSEPSIPQPFRPSSPSRRKVTSLPPPPAPLQSSPLLFRASEFPRYPPVTTSYPSPPDSNYLLSPSASLSSLPTDNAQQLYRSGSFDSFASPDFIATSMAPRGKLTTLSVNPSPYSPSSPSDSPPASIKSNPSPNSAPSNPASPSTFVFPSSRSRARPSTAGPSSSSPFKFKSKKKKQLSAGDALPRAKASAQVLAPGTPTPAQGFFTSQTTLAPSSSSSSSGSISSPQPTLSALSVFAPSPQSGSPSSSSDNIRAAASTPTPSPRPFVFPSSRSHPSSLVVKIKDKNLKRDRGKGKAVESDGLGERFMGLALNRRKKSLVPGMSGNYQEQELAMRISPFEYTVASRSESRKHERDEHEHEPGSPHRQEARFGGHEQQLHPEREQEKSKNEEIPRTRYANKVGSYPLDPYDSTLLESDRQTSDLLKRLNPTSSPSFHTYGNNPPLSVLDLGCGQGHWLLDAAVAWRDHETQVVGFDMVDTTKSLWPQAAKLGVANNIKFVRGNFLKKHLPFPSESFELVRMSNLALCISYEKWEFVLQEVRRVLMVGGRLEIIDDHIFFPYGKAPLPISPQSVMQAPTLNISIPSSAFSTFDLSEADQRALENMRAEGECGEMYNLYGVPEEDDNDDASDVATLGSVRRPRSDSRATLQPQGPSPPPDIPWSTSAETDAWNEQASAARELESLLEHMLNMKFGIHLRPSEFIVDLLTQVFGQARQLSTMHLTLAPLNPNHEVDIDEEDRGAESWATNADPVYPQSPAGSTARAAGTFQHPSSPGLSRDEATHSLAGCPGLMLWPSTFIPMPLAELESHASKHMKMLLSCKTALAEYAAEVADEDDDDQEEAVKEALWEYENFSGERLNPPPDTGESPSATNDVSSLSSDTNSIFSVNSMSSEAQDAMLEYQSELGGRFDWTVDQPDADNYHMDNLEVGSNTTPRSSIFRNPMPPPNPVLLAAQARTREVVRRDRSSSMTSSVAPPYSRIELTHVRTFYVFEAIKTSGGAFGAVI